MINTGRIQDLTVLRRTSEGLVLGDDDAVELVLPNSECPKGAVEGSLVNVFVYRDRDGKHVVTTRKPKAQVGEFAMMRMRATRGAGATMEWGMEPDLLVPHEEQRRDMEEGRWYVVRVALDPETDRPYGSTRIETFLDNSLLTVKSGDEVALMVFGRSDLGLSVIVNDIHQGLVHNSEVFKQVSIGDRITGYVKTVREDNKLDIVLQPIGYRQFIDVNVALVAKRIQSQGGFLPLTDKSSADAVYDEFGISKKAFKKALGFLYKERLIRLEEAGVVWVG
jgi:predicted RNA-binding protein (virulence factor B family)